MSLSKVSSLCVFCDKEKALYKCPKCNVKYCSSKCFNNQSHGDCSELFYQKWVLSTLQDQKASKTDAEKMMDILKKAASEDHDEVGGDLSSSLEARFSDINLSEDVEESKLWERLTPEEQDSFKKLLSNDEEIGEIIPVIQPWWMAEKVNVVENPDMDDEMPMVAKRPPLPIGIKTLATITTKHPSNSIQYNVLNVLYCYTCLVRLYNNELTDFIEDVVDAVFCLSPVFSENKNYTSLDEVVQDSFRLITSWKYRLDINFAKSLSYDVCRIISGPMNARRHSYVICALSDVKTLLLNFKSMSKGSDSWKSAKKLLLPAIRKLDYFLSWSVDYYEANLTHLMDEIKLKYLPEIINDNLIEPQTTHSPLTTKKTDEKSKVLIEEIN